MANIPDKGLIEFPGFPRGIDNRSEESKVSRAALREAVNVDLDDSGKPRRRKGYSQALSGVCHSVYEAMDALFLVRDGELVALDDNLDPTVVLSGFSADLPVSYAYVANRLFWTDGARVGMVLGDWTNYAIWPSAPPLALIQISLDGGLPAGLYQVAMTCVDSLGRESGASLATMLNVPEGGGIQISNMVTPAGCTLRVYRTSAGGDSLHLAAEVPVGASSGRLGAGPEGKVLDRQWLQPMPAGQAMCYAAGRLWVARGEYLYYSEPLMYGAMLPDNYIKMAGDITLLAPVGDAGNSGLYVAAGKRTLYLTGPDPRQMSMLIARPAGAVAGTAQSVSTELFVGLIEGIGVQNAAVWLGSDGVICLGLPSGQTKQLGYKHALLPENGSYGAILVREKDGLSQLVVTERGGVAIRAGASDELVGTVYRNGIAVD